MFVTNNMYMKKEISTEEFHNTTIPNKFISENSNEIQQAKFVYNETKGEKNPFDYMKEDGLLSKEDETQGVLFKEGFSKFLKEQAHNWLVQ